MFEINHSWASSGSSGGLTPYYVAAGVMESVLYCEFSTLATTNTVEFQTAISSGGPWFVEASTTISTALNGLVAIRVTGPYIWMRPNTKTASTGTYTFRLIGNS